MQPSQYDIQREVEALRDLRRRSTTPGALALDPDLPNSQSPISPTSPSYYDEASTEESLEESPITPTADDPFHLFWVPASVHPEIAPAEFRAFLKEHARNPHHDGLERSNSASSSILGRKKSMLSRQYRPEDHDNLEEEKVVPLRRNRSSLYANPGPQLTINDLQRLEELAEQASDDPAKLRTILRRSLSLNVSPTAMERMDDMPDIPDEADAPIIPRPGQILRRAARTKIRKPGLPGDGGGHRFGASRRRGQQLEDSDRSSSDHGDSIENVRRPESFSEEGLIYDAYARDDDPVTESPPQSVEDLSLSPTEITPSLLEALGPILQHPETESPQPPPEQPPQPSRTPSPSSEPLEVPVPTQSPPPQPSIVAKPPSPPTHRKEKDKKGLFGKWGGDKASKKAKKEQERERAEKEKESSFFGSLFGSKKNKDSDHSSQSMGAHGSAAGREAAQASLGASKSSKNSVAPTSPNSQPLPPGVNNYSRYPIHVERAIYRLSHIKLANPRRPLYEQVLISNLMFWYLGVINKAQNVNGQVNGDAEKREREQKERAEKERLEAEQREKERQEAEREMDMKKREASSPRRGPLTKPAPAGGSRRAEMPVKGPQYEMQHRVMEQEYGYGPQQPPRTSPVNTQYQRPYGPSKMGSPTQESNPEHFYYSGDMIQSPQPYRSTGLPPGAMPPVDQQSWLSQSPPSSPSPPPNKSPPRSRSPPSPQQPIYSQENAASNPRPHRSQSAIVTPSPQVNGKIRKGTSAYAGTPTRNQQPLQNGSAEEEDVPLAVWQQQRRR